MNGDIGIPHVCFSDALAELSWGGFFLRACGVGGLCLRGQEALLEIEGLILLALRGERGEGEWRAEGGGEWSES